MPSADFCRPFPSPLDNGSTRQIGQISPGNAHPPSRLCPPHLRPCLPDRYGTLKIVAFSSGMTALYAISVRRTSALPAASFRFHLAMDTLAVRLTVPPVGPVEDFHLHVGAPCRAHHKKGRATKALPGFVAEMEWPINFSLTSSNPPIPGGRSPGAKLRAAPAPSSHRR